MVPGLTHIQRRAANKRKGTARAYNPLTEGDLWWIAGGSFLLFATLILRVGTVRPTSTGFIPAPLRR